MAAEPVEQLVQRYLALYAQRRWDEWIALWADDGVLEFPFAPAGRQSRYAGTPAILAYMQATAARMGDAIEPQGVEYFRLHPLQQPATLCFEMAVKGRVRASGEPYLQRYISIVEAPAGRIALYREYWNPLASIAASGGQAAWTAGFGSPA